MSEHFSKKEKYLPRLGQLLWITEAKGVAYLLFSASLHYLCTLMLLSNMYGSIVGLSEFSVTCMLVMD